MPRARIAGPDEGPEPPFPIRVSRKIIKGFGRGSKELGIPTANIPVTGLEIDGTIMSSGIYFGWAGLSTASSMADASAAATSVKPQHDTHDAQHRVEYAVGQTLGTLTGSSTGALDASEHHQPKAGDDRKVYPMVMSVGWNPFYKNDVRSIEVHIIHKFEQDFYNAAMNLVILRYIRPELDYEGVEKLIEDIQTDIEVTGRSLDSQAVRSLCTGFLSPGL